MDQEHQIARNKDLLSLVREPLSLVVDISIFIQVIFAGRIVEVNPRALLVQKEVRF
jgi:hypothetical protein